ncbi:MAG TPA: GAF domain-containing protein [Pirellulaceae bacterium]|nr:GAF domain-containing protein [Pirellulaceae bacterium]
MSTGKRLPTDEGAADDQSADGTESATDQKRQEIRDSILRLRDLAQTDISFGDYCQRVVEQIIALTAAHGAVVWHIDDHRKTEMVFATGPASAEALVNLDAHRKILNEVHSSRTPRGVDSTELADSAPGPTHSAATGDEEPQAMLFLVAPIVTGDRCWGLFELIQRADLSEPVQQGYLKFLNQVAGLFSRWWEYRASQFQPAQVFTASATPTYTLVHNGNMRPAEAASGTAADRGIAPVTRSDSQPTSASASSNRLMDRLDFVREIHQSIRLGDTVYCIANATRRLLQCDRVSVAISRGSASKIKAISSQDRFDNRSNVIKKLGQLAQLCVQSRTTLWLHGKTAELPPQLTRAVNDYLDESHSRTLAVIPLEEPSARRDGELERRAVRQPQQMGALIIEHFARDVPREALGEDLPLVIEQSAAALANARQADEIFLAPLWLSLGKTWRWLWDDHRKKTMAIVGIVIGIILMLSFWPATLKLKIHGVAQPQLRRNLFTQIDGFIENVHVKQQDQVRAGDLLLEMDSLPLRLKRVEIMGQIETLGEQIQSLDRQLATLRPRIGAEEALTLTGTIEQLTIQRAGLHRQIELIDRHMEALKIYSPIDGVVLTWDTHRLEQLPVDANQPVLTVADVEGPWHLELMIPQGKLGYISRAMRRQQTDWLPADFILATDPNHRYRGRLIQVAERGEMGPNGEVEFRAIVALEADQIIRQQPGAGVTVRVACGRHSLGLVWFHQIIDYVRTRIFF